MAEQMQAYTRASALNRSADDSERSMMQRRKYHQANPQPEPPPLPNMRRQPGPAADRKPEPAEDRQPEPVADRQPGPGVNRQPEPKLDPGVTAEIDAQVAEAHCASLAAAKAAAGSAPVPPAAANVAVSRDTGPPGNPQFKDSLLRGSTLAGGAAGTGVPRPG